jgi:hypothetical protein
MFLLFIVVIFVSDERSNSHVYQPAPVQVKGSSLSPIHPGDNPLYGEPTNHPGDNPLYGEPTTSPLSSPDVHTFENNLYEGTSDAVYAEVGHNVHDSSDGMVFETNISYESLRSPHKTKSVSNPVYGTTTPTSNHSNGTFSPPPLSPPPVYSVPRPTNESLGEGEEYAIPSTRGGGGIPNGGTHASTNSANPLLYKSPSSSAVPQPTPAYLNTNAGSPPSTTNQTGNMEMQNTAQTPVMPATSPAPVKESSFSPEESGHA